MVRQRIRGQRSDSPSSPDPRRARPSHSVHKKGRSSSSSWSTPIMVIVTLAAVGFCAYMAYQGYLETRINTPLAVPRAVANSGLAVPDRFWGSYRSGLYFGMKTRAPADLLAGLMWLIPEQVTQSNLGLRHWCDQNDNLRTFGWHQHDGETFGIQHIGDRDLSLTTSFVKAKGGDNGGDWTARITVEEDEAVAKKNKKKSTVSLFFYFALDDGASGELRPQVDSANPHMMRGIKGRTDALGRFKVTFQDKGNAKQYFHTEAASPGPHKFTDSLLQKLRMYEGHVIGLNPQRLHDLSTPTNMVVYQVVAESLPFELDISFESASADDLRPERLTGDAYTRALSSLSDTFHKRFERTFPLGEKGYSEPEIRFAKAALSNMIGGIGYFYGHSIVKSDLSPSPVKYWDAPLYTAVPSRSFFPRGFLWDEGFHNLLVSKWSGEISADILAHWMDLVNVEGWIPREQILGPEARAKVPDEFVVQRSSNANPPTLLLTLSSMVSDVQTTVRYPWFADFLDRMWPRLETWYNWFDSTQRGEVPGTYRWRGRNGTTLKELNPKTLTSGLDDFPRASHPTDDERHLDLRCWMALAAKLMAQIANIIGKQDAEIKYSSTAQFLYDNVLLNAAHWSQEHGAYLDFGLHTEDVKLARPNVPNPRLGMPRPDMQRVAMTDPRTQYVPQVGYISLFPLLLEIVDVSSPHFETMLKTMEDPKQLFTPYGLRSLSKSATLYNKRNTEHDPPYWRGPIWININYLAVRALHHYSNQEGPYQDHAKRVYQKLRTAVVSNVIKEYERTGYIWEQYNDGTGEGQGCRPFTGWSALVVLMMGENY